MNKVGEKGRHEGREKDKQGERKGRKAKKEEKIKIKREDRDNEGGGCVYKE